MLDVAAVCLAATALSACLNQRFVGLPTAASPWSPKALAGSARVGAPCRVPAAALRMIAAPVAGTALRC